MKHNDCLFCDKEKSNILIENDFCYARTDNFPVSKGHIEIVPKNHIVSFFNLNNNELIKIYDLLNKTKKIIDKKYKPDSYNIGINEGEAAGRTINHLHIHLIPRYKGDVKNSQGGVRNIIPKKRNF